MDIHERTTSPVERVLVHPNPRPVPTQIATITATRMTPRNAADADKAPRLRLDRCQYSRGGACRNAGRVAPHRRASAMPTNPKARMDAILIMQEAAITTAPAISSNPARLGHTEPGLRSRSGESSPRKHSSIPASISPSIRASLWMPPTRCRMSRGFIAPSHSAATGDTPHRFASRGRAHTIRPTPNRASARCATRAAGMYSPVTWVMLSPSHRNSGP